MPEKIVELLNTIERVRGKEYTEGRIVCWACEHEAASSGDKCRTCIYRSDRMYINRCDYLTITGHGRGCAGDEHCKRYQRGPRKRKGPPTTVCGPAMSPEELDVCNYIKSAQMQSNRRYSLEKSLSRAKRKLEGR